MKNITRCMVMVLITVLVMTASITANADQEDKNDKQKHSVSALRQESIVIVVTSSDWRYVVVPQKNTLVETRLSIQDYWYEQSSFAAKFDLFVNEPKVVSNVHRSDIALLNLATTLENHSSQPHQRQQDVVMNCVENFPTIVMSDLFGVTTCEGAEDIDNAVSIPHTSPGFLFGTEIEVPSKKNTLKFRVINGSPATPVTVNVLFRY